MLVLPIGKGLLYVEPIYLESSSNNLPTLVRVVVSDGRKFVMERDLRTALARLVGNGAIPLNDLAATESLLQQSGQAPSIPLP
jgi:uncharacterized membrane protein (UPF0182 family)